MLHCSVSHSLKISNRYLSTTSSLKQITKTVFGNSPAPPRLPPKEQEEYERLQRLSTGSFSTPKISNSITDEVHINQESSSSSTSTSTTTTVRPHLERANVEVKSDGQELHPDIRRGAKPEFEGDRNPVTGEIGGPKTEPVRWGSDGERGDWSYNGRVTDF
ncbi:Succinate dehydrogenase assembly factor 4, mitochondrial [Erysiphe necator]|nr:Succinate dehydrogenase assembly factor 4, mitochondrial [Erysiphe necator]